MSEFEGMTRGGNGSHWDTCYLAHWDCAIVHQTNRAEGYKAALLTAEGQRLRAEQDASAHLAVMAACVADEREAARKANAVVEAAKIACERWHSAEGDYAHRFHKAVHDDGLHAALAALAPVPTS